MKKFFFFLILSSIAYTQNTGNLTGKIIDLQSQQPLEGASVILEGTPFGVISNAKGYFEFEDIPTQTYNLVISYLGYESQTLYNIIVTSIGNRPLFF